MKYTIEIAPVVDRQLQRFPKPDRKKILLKIESLAGDPRPHGYKELVGFKGFYRIRVGNYRIIYNIFDDIFIVSVIKVANHRDAY